MKAIIFYLLLFEFINVLVIDELARRWKLKVWEEVAFLVFQNIALYNTIWMFAFCVASQIQTLGYMPKDLFVPGYEFWILYLAMGAACAFAQLRFGWAEPGDSEKVFPGRASCSHLYVEHGERPGKGGTLASKRERGVDE